MGLRFPRDPRRMVQWPAGGLACAAQEQMDETDIIIDSKPQYLRRLLREWTCNEKRLETDTGENSKGRWFQEGGRGPWMEIIYKKGAATEVRGTGQK